MFITKDFKRVNKLTGLNILKENLKQLKKETLKIQKEKEKQKDKQKNKELQVHKETSIRDDDMFKICSAEDLKTDNLTNEILTREKKHKPAASLHILKKNIINDLNNYCTLEVSDL